MSEIKRGDVLLRVEGLCRYFHGKGGYLNKAVDNVSFDVKKGEVFGLVGESGCGKTTVGRSIIRIYPPTSGNVYFKGQRIGAGVDSYYDAIRTARKDGARQIEALREIPHSKDKIVQLQGQLTDTVVKYRREIKSARQDQRHCDRNYAKVLVKSVDEQYLPLIERANTPEEKAELTQAYRQARRRAHHTRLTTQMQMIFQDPFASLNPRMTVGEIIAEGLVIKGIQDRAYIEEKVREIMETVGLAREHAGRYPHEFSGGQQQRIGIARAVIMEPELIIADEPISALDVSIQAQVINLLGELQKKLGLTILFVAHDLSVVKYFSHRIGVMYAGKLVELASSDELFAHPLHPYTKSLLSAIPLPDPYWEKRRTRIVYDQSVHDYSADQPTFREIAPAHLVYCNDTEAAAYKKELGL